ncbi:MAG TPA: iron-sulfur cluster assembly scaffold protein [Clostridia bacterium]|nr:iron-sulfur cluster assembly scaffold protein [Clostridia bacterium]
MYSAQLLDHFQNPRNAGELAHATSMAEVQNPACGDVLQLWLRVDEGFIAAASFRARGCVSAMACASALTELLSGMPVMEARRLGKEQLLQAVGGVPEASTHAIQLALDAIGAALSN